MINYTKQVDSTDVSVIIRILDSTDRTPETGVVATTTGLDLQYRREGGTVTDITEANLTALDDAHSDGGLLHIGNGYYRLDVPDAAFATGADGVLVEGTVTGMIVEGAYVHLVNHDPVQDIAIINNLTQFPNRTIFLDTNFGGSGVGPLGGSANPVTSMSELATVKTNTGFTRVDVAPGSSFTATTALQNIVMVGENYDVNLGTSINLEGMVMHGANITAAVTPTYTTNKPQFVTCNLTSAQDLIGDYTFCTFSNVTYDVPDDEVNIYQGRDTGAFSAQPTFDFTASTGSARLDLPFFAGGCVIANSTNASNGIVVGGAGRITVAASSTAGTILVLPGAHYDATNGSMTITDLSNATRSAQATNASNIVSLQGDVSLIDSNVTSIKTVTDAQAANGSGLTAIPNLDDAVSDAVSETQRLSEQLAEVQHRIDEVEEKITEGTSFGSGTGSIVNTAATIKGDTSFVITATNYIGGATDLVTDECFFQFTSNVQVFELHFSAGYSAANLATLITNGAYIRMRLQQFDSGGEQMWSYEQKLRFRDADADDLDDRVWWRGLPKHVTEQLGGGGVTQTVTVEFFLAEATDLRGVADAILNDTGTTGVPLAASTDVYLADIDLNLDDTNTKDEYTVVFSKNAVPLSTGITNAKIQVIKRADGTDLVAETAMTEIGSSGSFKYDEATNRITKGEAVIAIVTATIDSATRTAKKVISRDV